MGVEVLMSYRNPQGLTSNLRYLACRFCVRLEPTLNIDTGGSNRAMAEELAASIQWPLPVSAGQFYDPAFVCCGQTETVRATSSVLRGRPSASVFLARSVLLGGP